MTYVFNIQGVVENIGVCPSYKYFFDLKKLDEIFCRYVYNVVST